MVSDVRSEPPISVRVTPDAVYLVGSAAGPLGGDCIDVGIEVGAGASLVVRSAAAMLALPGRGGAGSRFVVRATVADDASLEWCPEPTIAVAGCVHRMRSQLFASSSARVTWREAIVLGRHSEPGGSIVSEIHADVGGRARLRHALAFGPRAHGSTGPAVVGDARAFASLLLTGPGAESDRALTSHDEGVHAAAFPLEGGGLLVNGFGADPRGTVAAVDELASRAR